MTAVGDPFQAIYGWRGASVAQHRPLPRRLPAAADGRPAARYGLAQNNRSGRSAPRPGQPSRRASAQPSPRRGRRSCRGREPSGPASTVVRAAADLRRGGRLGGRRRAWAGSARGCAPREIAVLVRVRSRLPAYHDALVVPGRPGRGRRARWAARPARGGRPGGHAGGARRRDGQRGSRPAASRSALADRPARPRPARPAGRGARAARPTPRARRPRRSLADGDTAGEDVARAARRRRARASTRPRSCRWPRPSSGPVGLEYSRAGPPAVRPPGRRAAGLRRHIGEPLLDLLQRVLAATGLDVEVGAGCRYGPQSPVARRPRRVPGPGGRVRRPRRRRRACGRSSPSCGRPRSSTGVSTPPPRRPVTASSCSPCTRPRAWSGRWSCSRTSPRTSSPPSADGLAGPRRRPPSPSACAATARTSRRSRGVVDQGAAGLQQRDARAGRPRGARLGYVAVTRAQPSSSPPRTGGGRPRRCRGVRRPTWRSCASTASGGRGDGRRVGAAAGGGRQPALGRETRISAWPVPLDAAALAARREAADLVRRPWPARCQAAASRLTRTRAAAGWDRDLAALLEEAAPRLPSWTTRSRSRRRCRHPPWSALAADPDGLARDLARPMPRPPAPAARRGTRFHAWVECLFGQRPLLDRAELRGRGRRRPRPRRVAGRAAGRVPVRAVRGPAAAPGRGALPAGARGRCPRSDRRRLPHRAGLRRRRLEDRHLRRRPAAARGLPDGLGAIAGLPEEQVGAAFYYVASGRVDRPSGLASADELERLLTDAG